MASRILARALESRLREWAEDINMNLLDDDQSGFRKGRTTADVSQTGYAKGGVPVALSNQGYGFSPDLKG